jgi:hypothetical protein
MVSGTLTLGAAFAVAACGVARARDRQVHLSQPSAVAAVAVQHESGKTSPGGLIREELAGHGVSEAVGADDQDVAGSGGLEAGQDRKQVVVGVGRDGAPQQPGVRRDRPDRGRQDPQRLTGVRDGGRVHAR